MPNRSDSASESNRPRDGAAGRRGDARTRDPRYDQEYVTPMWRSPLFLGIAIGLAVLALSGWILWIVVQRRGAEQRYDAAMAALAEGQFESAAKTFTEFLQAYPTNPLADQAMVWRGIAQIKQHTQGGSPNWKDALKASEVAIAATRELPFFRERSNDFADLLSQTATGLATNARDRVDPASVDLSLEALSLLERTFDAETQPRERMDEAQGILVQARMEIEKDANRQAAIKEMELALTKEDPAAVYGAHERLFQRYPDLKADPKCQAARAKARELEAKLVRHAAVPPSATGSNTANDASALPPAQSLVRREAAPDAKRSGKIALAQVADSLYAVDAGNGEALWRVPVGFQPALRPTVLDGKPPSVLAHRVSDQSLILLDAATGKLLWRRPLEPWTLAGFSEPAVHGMTVYLLARAADDSTHGRVLELDRSDGRITGEFILPQPVVASPVIDPNRGTVLAIAEQSSLFVLDPKAKRCEQVIALDHERDAIRAAPVIAGRFLFVAESVGLDQSLLRCLVLARGDGAAKQMQVVPRKGWILHPPFALGGRLFLTTDQNHYAVFDLGAEEDANPLREIMSSAEVLHSRVDQPYPFATSEKEFWIDGERLQFHEVKVGASRAAAAWEQALPGAPAAPPRKIGDLLVLTAQNAQSGAVTLLALEPGSKAQKWRVELGEMPQALRRAPPGETGSGDAIVPGGAVVIQSGPDTIRFGPEERARDQIVERPMMRAAGIGQAGPATSGRLLPLPEWPEGTVDWGGPGTSALVYSAPGEPARRVPVPAPLAARPAILDKGLLLPCQDGRVYWIDPASGVELAEPFVGAFRASVGPVAAIPPDRAVIQNGATLLALQVVPKPFSHFTEQARLELGEETARALVTIGDRIIAQIGTRLVVLPAANLQPPAPLPEALASALDLGQPIRWALHDLGGNGQVALLTEGSELVLARLADAELAIIWRNRLDVAVHGATVGEPIGVDDLLWVTFADGTLLAFGLGDGVERNRLSAGRAVVAGPWRIDRDFVVLTADGSLTTVALTPGGP